MLFSSHDVLIARTKDFIYLRNTLCAICHYTNRLNATDFKYLAHTSNLSCHQDGSIHFAFSVRRSTKYDFLTTGYLGWCCKHQDRRKERSRTSRNIEANFLNSNTFLPTSHTRDCFHLFSMKLLALME